MQSVFGIIHIEEPKNKPTKCIAKYTIQDFGVTEVDLTSISPFALPHTYAPRINNHRQVTANRLDEGFIRDQCHGELVPQISWKMKGHAFGINDEGDLIVTIERNSTNVDWFVWTQKNLKKDKRYPIEPLEGVDGTDIDFRAINDSKWAVGNFNPGSVLRPAVWNPQWGLKPLGYYLGWDFKGVAWGINKKGTIVGLVDECIESLPYVWNKCDGLEILRNFKIPFEAQSCHVIQGPVHFADMVITDDDYVYGTLWYESHYYHDDGQITYFAYRWEPYNHDFRFLDLQGMRINGVNKTHILAGSLNGKAVLRDRGEKPIFLNDLLNDPNWDLLTATGINDHGDIVGIGKFQDKNHVFLLKKELQLE